MINPFSRWKNGNFYDIVLGALIWVDYLLNKNERKVKSMMNLKKNRFLAAILAVFMVISMIPMPAYAAEGDTATLVTDVSALNVGDQVVIVALDSDFALSTNQKTNNRGQAAVTKDGTTATLTADVQILTVENGTKEGTFAFYTGSGYLYAAGQSKEQNGKSNQNYLKTEAALSDNSSFAITIADNGAATLTAQGENGCNLMRYNATSGLFSCYISGQKDLAIYKLGTSGETPTEPAESTEATVPGESTVPTEAPAVEVVDISVALAGATDSEFTVKGVVTLVDGQNLYLQDATGAICLRTGVTPSDVSLGDTVIGTGIRADYNGLPQLGSGTYTKSEGLTLAPKETTIGALTTADVCTYVKISGVEVTEVYDNNGAWANPNITVKDSTGATIQLYKAVVDGIAVGDTVDILAAVGVYKSTTLQLRNTVATEVTKVSSAPTDPTDPTEPTEPEPTEPAGMTAVLVEDAALLTEGSQIIIVAADADVALSTTQNSNNRAEAAITKSGNTVTFGEDVQIITIENGTVAGTIALFVGDGYLYAASASSNYLRTEAAKSDNSSWTVSMAAGGVATIKANGSNSRNWLRYNKTSAIFSCYASGQKDVLIYKVNTEPVDPLANGSTVVIYAPGYMKALSATKTGNYNVGVDVTIDGNAMTGYGDSEVWTVIVNDDGTYSFANGGQNIAMADSYSSMNLGEVNDKWEVIDLGDGLYNVKNVGRGNFMEWYANYSNWSTYNSSSAATDPQFQIAFFPVKAGADAPTEGVVNEGDKVVIYNVSAEGVLAMQDENETSPSVNNAAATVENAKATAANGALIFTVERNGDYYRFYNETFGYLCTNGTGSNAFYQLTVSEDADWLLAAYNGGYTMESRTAKFNGKYSQYLEYYAGAYKSYSMYNVTDKDIYTFYFYPCVNENVTAGVVNAPSVVFGAMTEANVGMDYSFSFSVDAPFGVSEIAVTVGGTAVEVTAGEGYSVTVPASAVTGTELNIVINGVDTKGVAFEGGTTVTVNDIPVISGLTPASGSQTFDEKKPTISAAIINGGENPTVTMTVNDAAVEAVYENGVVSYTPAADMEDGRVSVTVTVTRADGKSATKTWSFTVGKAQFSLYFGQLHSHTTYSDGSGSLESALDYVKNLPESANVDFVAFTDHSNYFDKSGAANPEGALYDMSLATTFSQETWAAYKSTIAAFNADNSDIIAIGGFEMTWSGGPGHMNTFNSPGIVSRNNTTLNNKTSDAGMKAYYALLSRVEGADTISQFNHPGPTFGSFSDFAYWDAVLDNRIFLVEVGNGEGQIGQGGYYPSYEYYTMALDKGWHVAPTNNQDNHKGKWGNGNDARDVIVTDNFTEDGLYEAMRNYRVYATEDKNLEILYTVNGQLLGSMFEEVPEKLNISVSVSDPDATDSISKVEVIVNSGKTAYTWSDPAVLATGNLTCELDPTYSYYYIRVTEGDGDLAVTAPVWVGETLKLGISSVECGTSTPVTGEELTITTTLFNSESTAATVKALTYAIKGGEVLGTDTTVYTVPASGNTAVDFKYTPSDARTMTITVTAIVEIEGQEYTFTMDVTLDVQDADSLVYVGIDAAHYNEYVAGNYKDSMGNFSKLASEYNVRTVDLKTSEDLIAACSNPKYKALILTAPSRRLPAAQEALLTYTDAELEAIKSFNANGGMVILANWSDHYENYPDVASIAGMTADQHMAATQNAVLVALGSSLRMGDDATYDDSYNGGQAYRLYFNSYNFDSFLVEGVEVDEANPHDRLYTEVFSYYGGSSIYTVDGTVPATVTPVVFGHASTYSVDVDKDGLGGDTMPKYAFAEGDNRLLALATEQLEGKGLIVVSGAAFMSNFEVQATIEDSASEKNYANYKICENLLKAINPVKITPIAEVQAKEGEGYKFTIEGVVTSNASGYDKDTAFFDCIYLQDETAGINAFPVAGNFKIGDKVRITGTTSSYNGERQIAVTSIELISEGHSVEPTEVTAAQINDGSVLGSLVTLKGVVESFEYANGLIQTIMVKDAAGNMGRVFIDGYITTAKDVENLQVGCEITVTGLASYDNSFDGAAPRIRVRNRADVVCGEVVTPTGPDYYLIGWINGADHGCEDDWENMGDYKFVDGELTATFNQDSYVFIKTGGNTDWYMTKSYVTDSTAVYYNTNTGADEKMFVPGNVELTFTLVENGDGSLTLSYQQNVAQIEVGLKGFTLSFEDDILVNLYYNISDAASVAEHGMLVFYADPGAADIAAADAVYTGSAATDSYIATTAGIAAKEMGDDRYYCAYAKLADGTYVYSELKQYSPKQYALNRLEKSEDENMKALCVALLNYGAAAQTYFGYNTDALMNATLTAEQQALVVAYNASYFKGAVAADSTKAAAFVSTNSGFSSKAASVSFEGAFAINYYFAPSAAVEGQLQMYIWTPEDYAAAAELTADNASKVVDMAAQADGSYWAAVTGIAAKNLDETYYVAAVYTDADGVTHCTGVIAYALSKYCMNNDSGSMGELAQNTAMYGYYADIYFTNK